MPTQKKLLIFIVMLLMLAGCGGSSGSPADAIEAYLQALVAKDQDQLVNYSCVDWEEQAIIELDSLVTVTAELQDLQCKEASQVNTDALVDCSGKIVFNYNGELQELDLSTRQYVAREEDGQWRMCGYIYFDH
ncbi:MAG TPA: hypothetical protein PKM21_07905 [Anaerolineales bacterium]|nr:hypothetical protein [Anaerolineales bacterium]